MPEEATSFQTDVKVEDNFSYFKDRIEHYENNDNRKDLKIDGIYQLLTY